MDPPVKSRGTGEGGLPRADHQDHESAATVGAKRKADVSATAASTQPGKADKAPPMAKSGFSFSMGKKTGGGSAGSKAAAPRTVTARAATHTPGPNKRVKVAVTAASIFGDASSDEEVESMPVEAKMRMRNCGKFTPTSCGPNSFNKSSKGFTDPKAKVWDDASKWKATNTGPKH